jgi:hypothetical protein
MMGLTSCPEMLVTNQNKNKKHQQNFSQQTALLCLLLFEKDSVNAD